MTSRQHDVELLLRHDETRWGPIDHVICAGNNRSIALCVRSSHPTDRYIFRDAAYGGSSCKGLGYTEAALSYDGEEFAITVPGSDRGLAQLTRDILVNGERRFSVPYDTIHDLAWLNEHTLIWRSYNEQDEATCEPSGVYRNGVITESLDFQCHWMSPPEDRLGMTIVDYSLHQWWTIDDTGFMTPSESLPPHEGPTPQYEWHHFTHPNLMRRNDQGEAVPRIEERSGGMRRVVFRGVPSPDFHGIEHEKGMPEFAQIDDIERLVAYIGVRYGTLCNATGQTLQSIIEWCEEKDPGEQEWRSWLIGLPTAFFFSFIYDAWAQAARRSFPATQHHAWKKGYRHAKNLFFTPRGELVVTAYDTMHTQRVVIDEDEGPQFDAVHHVRWLHQEQAISYIGQRRKDFFRVVVR